MSYGSVIGHGEKRLQRLAGAWVDTDMVTVRRMAREGSTAQEIGGVLGWSAPTVRNFIRRNKLTWNKKSEARHAVLSAASRSRQRLPIDTSWRTTAERLHSEGASFSEIAKAVERSAPTVRAWLLKAVSA